MWFPKSSPPPTQRSGGSVPFCRRISKKYKLIGSDVSYVSAYELFPLTLLSTQVVSKVVFTSHLAEEACLLQTCTPVFRGHSGGMLCDSQGRLLGIITSNAKHSTGAIIPEINFAIPASFLQPFIAHVTDRDSLFFEDFEKATTNNLMLKSIWSLSPPPPEVQEEAKQEGSNFYAFFDRFRQSRL
jgi:hypothetical protein